MAFVFSTSCLIRKLIILTVGTVSELKSNGWAIITFFSNNCDSNINVNPFIWAFILIISSSSNYIFIKINFN